MGYTEGYSAAIGRKRGGLNTKTYALTNALGNPTAFMRPGQCLRPCDLDGADGLMAETDEGDLADRLNL